LSKPERHTKQITAAARDVLGPRGLVQKGRSRTWLDDRGWWLGVVEFQPSSWSRGSYLNVGVNFLWDPKGYLSFDVGGRVRLRNGCHGTEYVEFEDEEQFAPLTRVLVTVALEKIVEYRSLFPTPGAAAEFLASSAATDDVHTLAHAGIAFGWTGDVTRARRQFDRLLKSLRHPEPGWETDLRERATELASLVTDPAAFQHRVEQEIANGRAQLKLPA
jgi:hypothetical protein